MGQAKFQEMDQGGKAKHNDTETKNKEVQTASETPLSEERILGNVKSSCFRIPARDGHLEKKKRVSSYR